MQENENELKMTRETYEKRLAYANALRDEKTLRFYDSLIALDADGIAPPIKEKPSKTLLIKRLALGGVFLLLLIVFIVAARSAIYDVVTYKLADDSYRQLSGQFSLSRESNLTKQLYPSDDDISLPDFSEMLAGDFVYKEARSNEELGKLAVYRAKLEQLRAQNPDTYGWITVEGTNVDYPLVQAADNDYYLKHDFTRNSYSAGAIFVDFNCSPVITDNCNTVIYGHNIRTRGIMFNQILRYMEEDFFKEHHEITVYTPDGVYTYTVFSFFQTTAYSGYTQMEFAEDAYFVNYCRTMKYNSWHDRETVPDSFFTPESKLLTLSTCTNGDANERYALVAVLTDKVENE